MNSKLTIITTALVTLYGCCSNYTDRVTYDTDIANATGTIIVTDAKVFGRELLIAERDQDLKWIDELIAGADSIKFGNELISEMENISILAAGAGLKFDPVSAINFNSSKQQADLVNEINTTALRLQLEQLQKDVDIIRSEMDAQTTAVNQKLNEISNQQPEKVTGPNDAALDELTKAIASLTQATTTRLDTKFEQPTASSATLSPFDEYRNRSAYRNLLKSTRNATLLDERHDTGGNQLVRLQLQTTILPDPDYARSLGVLEVKVLPPSQTYPAIRQLLHDWLTELNLSERYRIPDDKKQIDRQNYDVKRLLLNNFNIVQLNPGLAFVGYELLLPDYVSYNGKLMPADSIVRMIESDHEKLVKKWEKTQPALAKDTTYQALREFCTAKNITNVAISKPLLQAAMQSDEYNLFNNIQNALELRYGGSDSPSEPDQGKKDQVTTDEIATTFARYRNILVRQMSNVDECEGYLNPTPWRALAMDSNQEQSVRFYNIGPREQVQQISTTAHSASSLSLAASIAATEPSSGLGASAATEYARQKTGRATAAERVPTVVGYGKAGTNEFGWVFGPHAVLDGERQIDMAHLLKTHDLTADLSIPGWWPHLLLEHSSLWAPGLKDIAHSSVANETQNTTLTKIELRRSTFKSITKFFTKHQDQPTVTRVSGGPIRLCKPSTLLLEGDELWRASQIMYKGVILERSTITMAPDMTGIIVKIPANQNFYLDADTGNKLRVLTPMGSDEVNVDLDTSTGCSTPQAYAPATIASVTPKNLDIAGDFTVTIEGSQLQSIGAAHLNGQPGKLTQVNPGATVRTVSFAKNDLVSIDKSNLRLEIYKTDQQGQIKLPARTFNINKPEQLKKEN